MVVLLLFAVSLTEGCNRHDHDPVCDKNGEEFTNFCVLLAKGRYLDFRGHCPVSKFVLQKKDKKKKKRKLDTMVS